MEAAVRWMEEVLVLRTHVMVRVGGGWDTLEHYLDKHDPCRCAAFAHRYQQAKASGQGPHSKSSSTHSSRSTSPGPHWRNEGMAPYKTPDRRSLDPVLGATAHSSPSRPGRSHHAAVPVEMETNAGRPTTLLPRPPRDRSEPCHLNPLRNKESLLTRRLSGDSDSSTASSKGGGGSPGGGRFSLGTRHAHRDKVVLLVNRKEGKHIIERPGAGAQIPALRTPQTRARSASRERPAPLSTSVLKPTPPQVPTEVHRTPRTERGRSLGPEGPRKLLAPRSLSQGKTPRLGDVSLGSSPRRRDPHSLSVDRREELRPKHMPAASSKTNGSLPRRQASSSASNSPVKSCASGSPVKKGMVAPRPPAPLSPSTGSRKLLPPVTQPGRRSPHSSPRSSHHHPPRSPRSAHNSRPTGRDQKGWANPYNQQQESQEDSGIFSLHLLASLDPQKEQDLYRSFEAEFLANTQQTKSVQGKASTGGEMRSLQLPGSQQALGVLPASSGDTNVTDSAYSSSNSSTSSLNVGGKVGILPDLRESKRTNPRTGALEDPPALLHSQSRGGLPNGGLLEGERWGGKGGGLRKLPAISSSTEEGEASNPGLSRSVCLPKDINGSLPLTEVPSWRPNGGLLEGERWGGKGGGLRKLPAISSSTEEGEASNPGLSRNKESLLTRRLSGDSDSSTASSKGGGGSTGGGRFSLGTRHAHGDEVVLLVNRKEGKHVIERPGAGAQIPALRTPQTRARSASRERPAPLSTSVLKPTPPQVPTEVHRTPRTERGRSLGPEGPRKLLAPRSLSQGKTPRLGDVSLGSSPRRRDPHSLSVDRREELRPKHMPAASSKTNGSLPRRQASSSAVKKGMVAPRPPAPLSPSTGSRKLLPPVTQPGRRSPHSSPRSSHHHPPRSPRSAHNSRPAGRDQKGWANPYNQQQDSQEDSGSFSLHLLPSLDPQREQDLYRSFEAEFLANTQQTKAVQGKASTGREMRSLQLPVSQQGLGVLPNSSGDTNVTDSAYSSSNSSTSSLNVGGKVGILPDLRESKRTNPRTGALEDPPALLHSQSRGGLPNGGLLEGERWGGKGGGLRKLPAISSSTEEGEASNPGLSRSVCLPKDINGSLPLTEVPMKSQQDLVEWAGGEGDVPQSTEHRSDLPYDDADLPLLETFPSPPPPLDDCSYQDSSSESSSMCLSLSEPPSEGSCTPPLPLANGDTNDAVILRAKKGKKKAERVPSIYKLKLRPRIRPRTDNRPENSPSHIPTPVRYRNHCQQSPADSSPLQTPPQSPHLNNHQPSHKALHQAFADLIQPQHRSPAIGSREFAYSSESSLDNKAWM
ncbi:uncharacterized protein LOC107730708 [Sinocyclocheilus rhinocerous]|uniref:uncharacterized protein LOC107730708 n=1 Tax=Sinocyclocheilus rhinocerous TaxID=307959 RepID=UPI0007BA181B|nr:PREDICTED: uncharacterized protein LOC107730708 [Sinocyclocheilus rhinocerous]